MAAVGLVGRWRLVSWSFRSENGATAYPFDESAEGSLVYTPGGWMTVTLAKADRARLSTDDIVGGGEAERAAAGSSYVAYCGTRSPSPSTSRSQPVAMSTSRPSGR